MVTIEAPTLASAYRRLLRNFRRSDVAVRSPRGMKVKELDGLTTIRIGDSRATGMLWPARSMNYRFCLMEAAWYLSGSEELRHIVPFNSRLADFSDDGETSWGAYGPRIMGQLDHVLSTLRRDRDSRQAVITTWRPQVHALEVGEWCQEYVKHAGMTAGLAAFPPVWDGASWRSKDIPCTVAWHFQIVNNRLQLTVFMRSNDAWWGTPNDIVAFTTVQRAVACALGVEPGPYIHAASNMHLYERHWKAAESALTGKAPVSVIMPDFISLNDFDSLAMTGEFGRIVDNFDRSEQDDDLNDPMIELIDAARKDDRSNDLYNQLLEGNGR